MAKGDKVIVLVNAGASGVSAQEMVASKAGRTVRTAVRTRSKVQWLDVEEMTRTGRVTGSKMTVRLDAVIAISESRTDNDLPVAKKVNSVPRGKQVVSLDGMELGLI